MTANAYSTTSQGASRSYGIKRPQPSSTVYRPYNSPMGVRQSYSPTVKTHATPAVHGRQIKFGDRIYVRLEMGRTVAAEFEIREVNDFTELLGELRHYTRGMHGLARLYVRNMTRGWSQERPLMLYADADARERRRLREPAKVRIHERPRMLCPWETH